MRPILPHLRGFILSCSAAAALGLQAADWTQWRGPDRADHSPDTGLLKSWPAGGPKRLWLFDKAGTGYAGYSVVGQRLFTMGLRNNEEFIIAIDTALDRLTSPRQMGALFKVLAIADERTIQLPGFTG